ncbi:Palmitoylated vacuolar membrane-bound casein kinase [Komagataella phaffii CBS 7435]|uniref:non-specific serine/threonine protein kinase n=2 Tax=Komagataella phaffii TaxID=460519 RepID=C4R0F3_KOMPG|nr:Palmitoylated, plasma membrane-bound casein kinase I isoform [Komagataella phaffii GS115]AOA63043.1 GQ67_00395T0 [Komagataella phaffii]CAH2448507.1 Palmitoylated vacuolar membrane-bound casein kinase [Komagataella phaffii CBS 7435]AOA67203.1 GQ68_00994T0 [Komagataella phaffii GS115]CAY68977.1 Palmitoylated, plasma membrane-bound casein kinase I isoform [Komagataella phaffii GS115]CCA38624.1 Palmitoylated vacuolar membrane-bound casein kinase [Komagataella phaffii CBS 7435]
MSAQSPNIVASHYRIDVKIGEGSFGVIFKGYDLLRNNQPVAIKFESRKTKVPQLKDEFTAYKQLNSRIEYHRRYQQGQTSLGGQDTDDENLDVVKYEGIPKVYYFGNEGLYNILIIQLLGPSLEDLFDWCGRQFSNLTVAMIARQMIERIRLVHDNLLIYRDIKPDNFLIGDYEGTGQDNLIYLVDFGMVKQYRNPNTGKHIPYREKKALSGTARYMSINTHLGREQSRRDDLESLGHVFLYFLKGELPWQGLKANSNKEKYEKIGEKKRNTPLEEICAGFPPQFRRYMEYVRSLKFEDTPDYAYLIGLMNEVVRIETEGIEPITPAPASSSSQAPSVDLRYDWMRLNDGKGWNWATNKKTNLNGYSQPKKNRPTPVSNLPQRKRTDKKLTDSKFPNYGSNYGSNNYARQQAETTERSHSYCCCW